MSSETTVVENSPVREIMKTRKETISELRDEIKCMKSDDEDNMSCPCCGHYTRISRSTTNYQEAVSFYDEEGWRYAYFPEFQMQGLACKKCCAQPVSEDFYELRKTMDRLHYSLSNKVPIEITEVDGELSLKTEWEHYTLKKIYENEHGGNEFLYWFLYINKDIPTTCIGYNEDLKESDLEGAKEWAIKVIRLVCVESGEKLSK